MNVIKGIRETGRRNYQDPSHLHVPTPPQSSNPPSQRFLSKQQEGKHRHLTSEREREQRDETGQNAIDKKNTSLVVIHWTDIEVQ